MTRLLGVKARLAQTDAREMMKFLKSVHDPEAFVDIAAFSLCEDHRLKQKLLETLNVNERLALFGRQVRTEIESLKLRRKLQGRLTDDHIADN